MNSRPSVSIVIPTYNRPDDIQECVRYLENQDYDNCEIIIVNDGSSKDYTAVVDGFSQVRGNIRYILKEHSGIVGTKNRGLKESASEFTAFLDDDCLACSAWVRSMIESLLAQKADVAGGTLLSQEPETCVQRFSDAKKVMDKPIVDKEGRFVNIFTGNACFRTSTLRAVGGFDPLFETYHVNAAEDVDMTYRLNSIGAKMIHVPEAVVRHKHRESLREFMKQKFEYGRGGYFHCLIRGRDPKEIGHPDADIGEMAKEMLKYIVRDMPKRYREFRSEHCFSDALAFSGLGLSRRIAYYAGMLSAKREFSKIQLPQSPHA